LNHKIKLGFIGLGNMGYAIYKGVGNQFSTAAFDPFPRSEEGLNYVKDLENLIEFSDILILCVKPSQVVEVLSQIQRPVKLISIAAGITLDTMRNSLPKGSQIVRTMPNLPLMVGEGCLGYFGDEELYPSLEDIFLNMGMMKRVSTEKLLDAVTGLSGSGPAFVFSFLHAMAEGGVKSGLSYSDSLDLAMQTIKGSIEYFAIEKEKNPNLHPGELRNRVTSPAGTTIYGLAEWEKNSVSSGIMESIFQAYLRSKNL
jgi:pyrroline-5-carboxylate reductase